MYFSAKLIFETRPISHGDDSRSVEERIVLIEALNEIDAESEAILIGKSKEFAYEAADGGIVEVSFLGVRKIYCLFDDKIGHGTEIYSESYYISDV